MQRSIRGKLNDALILDLDGFKSGLQFDLFTVQHSPFLFNGAKDPAFTGSFGLAWYQSDIEIPRHSDRGHVQIRTILLDQIFGFDPEVKLAPTNTFHVGFWFNNPQDAAPCGFNPAKPTPFNGEHKAGPFAMISLPAHDSKLGPLCTDPNLSTNAGELRPLRPADSASVTTTTGRTGGSALPAEGSREYLNHFHRLRHSLDRQERRAAEYEFRTQPGCDLLRHENGRRQLLGECFNPTGQIDRLPHNAVLDAFVRTDQTSHDFAGVNSDTYLKRRGAVVLQQHVQSGEPRDDA